ncbi:mobile mystery protein B [Flavobacterium azooxidireducens]|uniref:Mobile mystery protein B n=1 Tax=Flavobacterium azooxidireducens TaxID=1871076 RepID=A0ABY4KN08_9FLAO|nr:mobile mystery protein B [Flavobacterium azooxidireducens]UPQ80617.1 mobile mystery protein B [Flavobacterium azooxidireducens]
MGLELQYEEGQTPLSEEEKEGLLIKTITTHAELDEYEQLNIENAVEWLMNKKVKKDKILTEDFIKALHKRMFGKVWKWAGEFRQSEKNIGIKWINIRTDLKVLLDDTSYWINNDTFPPDEIAIRFKHRLVNIHCFPNGNGRHSRLMADIIVESIFEKEIFSWHSSNMVKADEVRKEYIKSIRLADNGDIEPLIKFART